MDQNDNYTLKRGVLRRVLYKISLFDTSLSYIQGFNFIAASFISFILQGNFDEAVSDFEDPDSVWSSCLQFIVETIVLWLLFEKRFRLFFDDGFSKFKLISWVMQLLVEYYLPDLDNLMVRIIQNWHTDWKARE